MRIKEQTTTEGNQNAYFFMGGRGEEEAFFNGAIKSMIIKWLIYLAKIWWESHLTSLTG